MDWTNPFSSTSSQPDLSTFNYQTQQDKIKRQRALADQLMMTSTPQGQVAPGGYMGGSGFYVKPSATAYLANLLTKGVGIMMNKNLDGQQSDLDNNSLAAFQQQSAGLGAPVRDPNQDGVEAAAQNQREQARMESAAAQSGVQAGQTVGASDPPVQPSDPQYPQSQPIPQDGPSTAVPLPPVQAPSAIATASAPVKSVSSTVKMQAAQALSRLNVDFGKGDDWDSGSPSVDMSANPDNPTGVSLSDQLSGVGHLFKHLYGFDSAPATATPAAVPQTPPPNPPQAQAAPQAPASPQALPPMALPQPAAPQGAPQGRPAPQAPAALPPMPQASAPGMGQLSVNGPVGANPFSSLPQAAPGQDQLTNGTNVQTSNPTPYNLPPSQQDVVARLIALSRTSPEGQQIANAQLNQMFASKNGRFETKVMPDPVNGGFVQVTTDTATGQTLPPVVIGANGGKMVTGQTTDAQGNRLNVHKDGTTSPMVANGVPIQDPATLKANSDAVTAIVGKRSDAAAKLADLTKMESDLQLASGLVGQANVGPLAGTVGGVYNKFLGNSTANDTLDRVLNDSRLQQILQDKGGNGSVGAGLMKAYQGHSMSRDLSPSALSQGLGQALSTVQAQRAALQSEIGAHNFSLAKLGYQDPTAQAAAPPAAGGARPAGNYTF